MALEDQYSYPTFIECDGKKFLKFRTFAPADKLVVMLVNTSPVPVEHDDLSWGWQCALRESNDAHAAHTTFFLEKELTPEYNLPDFIFGIIRRYKEWVWREASSWNEVLQSLAYPTDLLVEEKWTEEYNNPERYDIDDHNLTSSVVREWNRSFQNKEDKNVK